MERMVQGVLEGRVPEVHVLIRRGLPLEALVDPVEVLLLPCEQERRVIVNVLFELVEGSDPRGLVERRTRFLDQRVHLRICPRKRRRAFGVQKKIAERYCGTI